MAQMALPTSEQKAKQVAKAQRHFDSLKKRHDDAKAIVDEVAPGLKQAEQYLTYLKGMPVVDADQTDEQGGDQAEQQQSLFEGSPAEGEQVFA